MTGETASETALCDNCTRRADVAFTLTTNVDGGGTVEARFCSSGCLKEWTAVTACSSGPADQHPHPRLRSRRARTY